MVSGVVGCGLRVAGCGLSQRWTERGGGTASRKPAAIVACNKEVFESFTDETVVAEGSSSALVALKVRGRVRWLLGWMVVSKDTQPMASDFTSTESSVGTSYFVRSAVQ